MRMLQADRRRGPVYIIDEAEGMFIGASVGSRT